MSFKNIFFGTMMMSSVRVVRMVAQFVAIPILSRLLTPEEYGLVAIAMPFAMFAMMIADAGIGMSLVRTPSSDRVAWSTSFWLTVMLGACLGLIIALLAPLAAYIFHEPALMPMIMALSFVVVAQATHLIPVAALQQAQRFHTIALVDVLSTAAGIVTAVTMAYGGCGAWALIGQQMALFAVRVSLMFWLSPFRPLRIFRWREVCEHVRFGRNVLGNALIIYFARSFDNWVVGKVLGSMLLGFYSMAFQFARLPLTIVAGPLQYVMYAQLAKVKDNKTALARAYLVATRILAIIIFPAMGMVAIAHTPVFELMLSEKWKQVGLLFMILAPACAIQTVMAISETVVYALGRSDIQLRSSAEYCALWILVLLVAVHFGLVASTVAFSLCVVTYQLRYLSLTLPLLGFTKREYYRTYRIPLAATALGMLAYTFLSPLLPESNWWHLCASGCIALISITAAALVQKNSLLTEIRQWNLAAARPSDQEIEAEITGIN